MTDSRLSEVAEEGMRFAGLGLVLALALPAAGGADTELLKASTVKITVEHSEGTSTGSGIILCQQDGRLDILTAKHVLTGQGLVDDSGERSPRFRGVKAHRVAFHRNSPPPVHAPLGTAIIRKAEFKDLALLTLIGVDAPVTTVRVGDSTALRAGVEVESVGHLDVDWDWTRGTVRSVGEFIRHSSDIDRGHSGGPVFNAAGEVVGLNLQEFRGVARAMSIEEAMSTIREWIDPRCATRLTAAPPPAATSATGQPAQQEKSTQLATDAQASEEPSPLALSRVQELEVALISVKRIADSMRVLFSAINKGNEVTLTLSYYSFYYYAGENHRPTAIRLGTDNDRAYANALVPSGISVGGELTFNIDPEARRLDIIRIDFMGYGHVDFRDVPIEIE